MISFAAIWTVGSNEFRIEERMMAGKRTVLLLAYLLALATIHVAFAQTSGSILGTVNDAVMSENSVGRSRAAITSSV